MNLRDTINSIVPLVAFVVATFTNATAQTPHDTIVLPSQIGLSQAKLDRVSDLLQREVDQGHIAGAVAMVARHGHVGYAHAVGSRDKQSQSPMQLDSLFRIASMTKVITCAAVLSLVEDGSVALNDPISKHLPEFADAQVLEHLDGDSTNTIPATRQPTIHDLLTHRSGLTYGWFGPTKLDKLYAEQDIPDFFVPTNESMASRVTRIARMPLKFQPGTSWDYGVSTDVLGRVVESVSGLTLEQFFRERFFRPLRMDDTHFQVPPGKRNRLSTLYTIDDSQSLVKVGETAVTKGFLEFSADYCTVDGGKFQSGGGGLVSTARNYMKFLQMLIRGGELDGVRVLQPDSVASMTRNQIGEHAIPFGGHGDRYGFGVGVLTDQATDSDSASVGTYSWGGIFNTYFWVDPQEQLTAVLMTQLFPYDHLETRKSFKDAIYDAIDDSGFKRTYWYNAEEDYNPHFNGRQLRVNAAEASIHPEFSSRSEPQSSGMARILIDEDLKMIRRVELDTEIWGGHPGTANKQIQINGRSKKPIPEVGSQSHHCTHQYPSFTFLPKDLVDGYNSLQFSCETGDTFWGHYIVDNATLKLGIDRDDDLLKKHGLDDFDAKVIASRNEDEDSFQLRLEIAKNHSAPIQAVHFQSRHFGFDENGDGHSTDWHGMTKSRVPYGIAGSATETPFQVDWNTSLLPEQSGVEFRAVVDFQDIPGIQFFTNAAKGFEIKHDAGENVSMLLSDDLPKPYWSRNGKEITSTIQIDVDPSKIVGAELHVVAWNGGPGNIQDYFTLNGQPLAVADGHDHQVVYTQIPIDPSHLKRGANEFRLLSDTKHHGIEIMRPGPTLFIRYTEDSGRVKLTQSAKDSSAGDLECFRIDTPSATYFLEKSGGGLSSMIDPDGNDWLAFHPKDGSGASGEYRGFPNAVFQEAGSYFHPRNAGTDPCATTVIEDDGNQVLINVESDTRQWAGQYKFTAESATFTMTKKPSGHSYWVLYEGVPGGQYDDSDWWMTSGQTTPLPMNTNHDGDIPAPEWIAFGDAKIDRSLMLVHHEDDDATDRFYQMQNKMTVFGFGRQGMKKHLNTVPQSFSIQFVEDTAHEAIDQAAAKLISQLQVNEADSDTTSSETESLKAYEKFALTRAGDVKSGKKIFEQQSTQCMICHQVNQAGGAVGPNLSKIGGKYDRPHLIEALLHPSKQVGYGYETTNILTVDGRAISGIVKASDANSVVIADAKGKRTTVQRTQIEKQAVSKTSIMPDGLAKTLTKQQFTDVIAYMESLGSGQKKWGAGIKGPVQLPSGFEITTVATGLSGATAMEIAPDGRIFVCEQGGQLRVIHDGTLQKEPFAVLPVEFNWERGLIGVTVSPNFPSDPSVYVVYVTDEPFTHHRVSRLTAAGGTAEPDSEKVLLRGDDQSLFGGHVPAGHQGGGIHFGIDGKLYVGLGEQTAKLPSQKMNALQGKILRINPDGSIPNDNPFVAETDGKYQSIWAIGCRNPFTFAIRRTNGEMLINDVGGNFEEINRGSPGANFGWPTVDHGRWNRKDFVDPIHTYPQSSINGGDFSDAATSWPDQFQGKYFFADFIQGWVRYIDPENPRESTEFANGIRRPVDLRFGPDGSLYVLLRNAWVVDDKFTGETGSLVKIRYTGNRETES